MPPEGHGLIISDRYRYLFIEQPHTASTAIHRELVELYDGRPILHKHATWPEFLAVATPEQKRYFVFAAIRNPLDEVVSNYFKYKSDHRGRYSDPGRLGRKRHRREAFDFVADDSRGFPDYLARYHRLPFDNDTLIHHRRMGYVIRYERLQEDFAEVLRRIGVEPVRPLPVVNKTELKGDYLSYYTPEAQDRARRVFGPFMGKWGYSLPASWPRGDVPLGARLRFRVLGVARYVYRRYIRTGSNAPARLMIGAFARIRPLAHRLLRG